MPGWITAGLELLAKGLDFFMAWWRDKGIKDAQHAEDQRDGAVSGLQEIDKAQRARDGAAADIAAGGMRRPDRDTAPRCGDGIS